MDSCDVVVIGAGHQGLVAATTLAEQGHDVVVVEAADRPGGAVVSGELTGPGFVHDLYATNMNLFLGSPYYRRYGDELARHGLSFARSASPYASAFPDGTSLRVTSDETETVRMFTEHDADDAAGWQRLRTVFDDFAAAYFPSYVRPLPSAGTVSSLRAALGRRASTPVGQLAKTLLASTRTLGLQYFRTPEARSLLAAWGMHLDYAPDITGGAVFPLLECFSDMLGGMSVVRGGASRLPEAMVQALRARGGTVLTGSPVTRIVVGDRGALGVVVDGDRRIAARRGVVSTLVLPRTVDLLPADRRPTDMQRAADDYRFGPGTFMLHLQLRGPVPWADARLAPFAYVHVGGYVDDMARTYQQAMAGALPDRPLLVVGQTSVVDPTRTPDPDRHVVWVQVRTVPGEIRDDAVGAIAERTWRGAGDRFADRVVGILDQHAPGLADAVAERVWFSPDDLQSANANLVGGDSVSGSHHLDQFLGFRPSAAMNRYRTPVPGLYLAGAGTWPGAGTNAVSGELAAQALLRRRPSLRR